MEHLNHLLGELLRSQVVVTALSGVVLGVLAYLNARIKALTNRTELDQQVLTEQAESNKRSALRNEYLQIYNSPHFTIEQKWGITRDIVADYKRLNGNHYIHLLEEELKAQLEKEGDK